HYQRTNGIVKGGAHPEKRCREAQAATAFLWFLWAMWIVSLGYSCAAMKGHYSSHVRGQRPGRRTQMSQI
ncbi:hypothetical protein KEM55_003479, partial [Ascosphaera atra]